jgi:CHAT domain-containing protein/tetratricopeptide (TPR) repeat protein
MRFYAIYALLYLLAIQPTDGWGQPAPGFPQNTASIHADHSLESAHGASEQFRYALSATGGESYLVEIEQRDLDLQVTVEYPDGDVQTYNSPLFRDERELVLLENLSAGTHFITLSSQEHTGVIGGHAIRIRTLHGVDATDMPGLSALRFMTQGAAASAQESQDAWQVAVNAYKGAAQSWMKLGRTRERAQALFSVASIQYWHLLNWKATMELAGECAELYRKVGEAGLAANATHLLAAALIETATEANTKQGLGSESSAEQDYANALALFESVLRRQQSLGNLYDAAVSTNNIGLTNYYMGDWTAARDQWRDAAAKFRTLDEWSGELLALQNLSVVDAEEGYVIAAVDGLTRTLSLLPPDASTLQRSIILDNLGAAHRIAGNIDASLQAFSAALAIQEASADAKGEARSLSGIGETYYSVGELELAAEYLDQALPKTRAANDGRGIVSTLRYLGNIAFLRGDYTAAFAAHQEALNLSTSPPDRGRLLILSARDLRALDRRAESEQTVIQALAVAHSVGSPILEADAHQELGRIRLSANDIDRAEASFNRALEIHRSLVILGGQAEALNGLALASRARGELDKSLEFGVESLQLMERLRGQVADPELRAFYAASRREYHELQVDLLMQAHAASANVDGRYLRDALAASERTRARMTVELLQEASLDLSRGLDAEVYDRQRALYEQLAERRYQRDQLLASDADSSIVAESLNDVVQGLASIENQLNLLDTELRRSNPAYASLKAPESLSADAMQGMLDADSVLLQYVLGEQRSFVWIVTADSLDAVELAPRAEIEAIARTVLKSLRRPGVNAQDRRQRSNDLRQLADRVLTPAARQFQKKRIIVAADGGLQYIPFSVLPISLSEGVVVPLGQEYEIVAVPSLSAIHAHRANAGADRPTKTIAVVADPVFEADDPRFSRAVLTSDAPEIEIDRGIARRSLRAGTSLQRLSFTGAEADAIAELVPEDQRLIFRGFDANRRMLLGADLQDYRVLHFATHGLIDSRYPALSALALSMFDRDGNSEDGLLRLHDIYNLPLAAELVVLSACDTALGRAIRGEGLIGLTQGFLYAGSKSILASLWQVPDRATAEFMTRFYDAMLNEGLHPAAALQKAQIATAAQRRWRDPYYWGAFVLLGDWQ